MLLVTCPLLILYGECLGLTVVVRGSVVLLYLQLHFALGIQIVVIFFAECASSWRMSCVCWGESVGRVFFRTGDDSSESDSTKLVCGVRINGNFKICLKQ